MARFTARVQISLSPTMRAISLAIRLPIKASAAAGFWGRLWPSHNQSRAAEAR
jgi:hypothetical protein